MNYNNLLIINIKYLKKEINKSAYCCQNEDYSNEDTLKLIKLNRYGFYTTHFEHYIDKPNVEIKSYIEGFIDNLYINLIIDQISKCDDLYYLIDNPNEQKTNIPFTNKYYNLTRTIDNDEIKNYESIPENWPFFEDKTGLFNDQKKYFINKSYLILVSKDYNYNS